MCSVSVSTTSKTFRVAIGGTFDFDQRQNLKRVIIVWTVEQFSHRENIHLRGCRLTNETLFFLCSTVNNWVTQRHFSPCPDISEHSFCYRQCPCSSNFMTPSEVTVTSLKTVISANDMSMCWYVDTGVVSFVFKFTYGWVSEVPDAARGKYEYFDVTISMRTRCVNVFLSETITTKWWIFCDRMTSLDPYAGKRTNDHRTWSDAQRSLEWCPRHLPMNDE